MSDVVVHADSLGKRYSSFRSRPVQALQDFSLTVSRGEVFGLLGPNGAGKTTFVKALLGIIRPTSGRAHLLGHAAGHPASRARVGYLPEQHRFSGHLTAKGALDIYGRLHGFDASTRGAEIERLLNRVGLKDWGDVKVKKFSKGMMQRLGLAQALMGDPEIVFLDEPTDGVDPIGRKEIREIVTWLSGTGTTIFLNSHLLSEVEMVCTRVAILNKGKLVSLGSVADLTRAPAAYEAVASPIANPPEGVSHDGGDPWATYRIEADSPEALTEKLRALIGADAVIKEVREGKRSLEQAFVEIVTEEAA
ncbi:MAG: ABC transporter ATP-binding protein [Rhodothermales bacterium]|nr:ABC transporter ATP-binding protein [Rhodothermales bacterium]MBO6780795.1 ABC transporter ATP-binding protein [Rhodothermales bacterium]